MLVHAAMLISIPPLLPSTLQHGERLDSEINYDRDFDYDYFGFKVGPRRVCYSSNQCSGWLWGCIAALAASARGPLGGHTCAHTHTRAHTHMCSKPRVHRPWSAPTCCASMARSSSAPSTCSCASPVSGRGRRGNTQLPACLSIVTRWARAAAAATARAPPPATRHSPHSPHSQTPPAVGIHLGDIDAAVRTYHLLSERWFTHASPTLFNAGTPRPQLSSCFLVCSKGDSIEGIYDTLKECAVISKSAGGIGVSIHNIRATGSYIRGTNGTSNGIVPMLRVFNDTAR